MIASVLGGAYPLHQRTRSAWRAVPKQRLQSQRQPTRPIWEL